MITLRFLVLALALITAVSVPIFGQGTAVTGREITSGPRKEPSPGPQTAAAPITKPKESSCLLSLSNVPLIAGVNIGMSYEDVSSIYPEIKNNRHFHGTFDNGGSGLFMVAAKDLENPAKEDAIQISLNFEDYAVQIISLVYDENKWTSIEDARGQLARLLGVEEEAWTVHPNQAAVLTCVDFKIYANSQGDGRVRQNSMSVHPLSAKRK